MNLAVRVLPPLAVIAAFAGSAVLLHPDYEPLQHTICLNLPIRTPSVVDGARPDVEGCFLEWAERGGHDVDLVLRLDSIAGRAYARTETGPDAPDLRACVEAAIMAGDYEYNEHLVADVFVHWRDRDLEVTTNVVVRTRVTPPIHTDLDAARRQLVEAKRRLEALKRERARLLRER